MESVTRGELAALQPMHWLAEVGAVLARESPETAADDVTMLNAFELAATDDPLVLKRGVELAIELKQREAAPLRHLLSRSGAGGGGCDAHYGR